MNFVFPVFDVLRGTAYEKRVRGAHASFSIAKQRYFAWLFMGTMACSSSAPRPPHTDAPNTITQPVHMALLQRVQSAEGGMRTLADLDLNGDQQLNALDAEIFHAVAAAARQKLQGRPVGVQQKLYVGPKKNQPTVFSQVRMGNEGEVDLSAVPVVRMEELAVEARWAAGQVDLMQAAQHLALKPTTVSLQNSFSGALRQWWPGYNEETMTPKALCAAIQTVDLSPFNDAGITPIAIFDLDSTVWSGNVTDAFLAALTTSNLPTEAAHEKLRTLLKNTPGLEGAPIDKNTLAQNGALMLKHLGHDVPEDSRVSAKDGFYTTVNMLEGLSVAQVDALAETAYLKGAGNLPPWKSRLFTSSDGCGMRKVISTLRDRGFRIYLLSATLDPLARMAAKVLNIPDAHALGSLLEVKDGKYTGAVKDSTYYAKGAITRQWLPGPPLLAFGDSPRSDFSMLMEAAGAAFMVNARPAFRDRDLKEANSRLIDLRFDGVEGGL